MDNNIKLRTIPQAFKEIRAKDPDTAMTVSLLRRLVSSGKIPSVPNGKHPLVNISVVEKYMSEGGTKNPEPKDNEFCLLNGKTVDIPETDVYGRDRCFRNERHPRLCDHKTTGRFRPDGTSATQPVQNPSPRVFLPDRQNELK